MRSFFLFCGLSAAAAMGQSMLEVGGIVGGSSVGSAAGKKLSDSLSTTLKKTAKATEKAAAEKSPKEEPEKEKSKQKQQQADIPVPAPVDPAFLPSRSKGTSSDEANNVPPPPPAPPKKKAAPQQPVRAQRAPAPVVVPVRYEAPKPEPLNVDLSQINSGMRREEVLKLGAPSSRISMYEGGHLLEIYNYRNATFASGSLRLQDGTVTSVEAR
jgi:hypothetical protein